ncbi:hypothetical protein WKI65_43345 [Streptomyces sp. MS1.AVA.3]|uniref:hypothetical protein n=1 Tax=Streptomyces decoyicus TaxID=249567 RepID=UPI0030BC6DB5
MMTGAHFTLGADAVTKRSERELAVEHWLLSAAEDRRQARGDWSATGIAFLRCGGIFSAVSIPTALVQAAASSQERARLDAYLTGALLGGPVIASTAAGLHYALVPPSTARNWSVPETECLAPGASLAVPAADRDAYGTYWSVPMDSPGDLCVPAAVAQMALYGVYRQLERRDAGE